MSLLLDFVEGIRFLFLQGFGERVRHTLHPLSLRRHDLWEVIAQQFSKLKRVVEIAKVESKRSR